MRKVSLLIALHNHQPIGNFGPVFEHCYQRAYLPTLDVWDRHPRVPFSLHNSGVLWDWLGRQHPEYVDRVGAMAFAGHVELLTGGHYEPILPVISAEDRHGQIRKLSEHLRALSRREPAALWLAERVWEPGLPVSLEAAGVKAVFLDDEHFLAAGFRREDLCGTFMTEDSGKAVAVFPILKDLRYLVPFEPPARAIEFLRDWADESGERLAVLGDDGEKFGVWPETFRRVFDEGWLEEFLGLLENNSDWLQVTTPSQWLASHRPRGLAYLPASSYGELTGWALPREAQEQLERYRHEEGLAPELKTLLRGGYWRNFLTKYPESNRMHKRVLDLSERVKQLEGERRDAVQDRVWQAQCNCGYWHGVFGGLYLPHLRDGIHRRVLEAEQALAQERGLALAAHQVPMLSNEGEAWMLQNQHLSIGVLPDCGGGVFEWGDFRTGHDLGNVIARRQEAYHALVPGAVVVAPAGAGETRSIHDRVRAKEPGLERLLVVDRNPRLSFLDHLLPMDVTPADFEQQRWTALGELASRPYETSLEWDKGRVGLEMSARASLLAGGELEVSKRFTLLLDEPGFEVRYEVRNLGDVDFLGRFGVEWNITYLAGESTDRWLAPGPVQERVGMRERGCWTQVNGLVAADEWLDLAMESDVEPGAELWTHPVETVSQSEDGFERIYQGTCLLFHWPVRIPPGKMLCVRFEPRARRVTDPGGLTTPTGRRDS